MQEPRGELVTEGDTKWSVNPAGSHTLPWEPGCQPWLQLPLTNSHLNCPQPGSAACSSWHALTSPPHASASLAQLLCDHSQHLPLPAPIAEDWLPSEAEAEQGPSMVCLLSPRVPHPPECMPWASSSHTVPLVPIPWAAWKGGGLQVENLPWGRLPAAGLGALKGSSGPRCIIQCPAPPRAH